MIILLIDDNVSPPNPTFLLINIITASHLTLSHSQIHSKCDKTVKTMILKLRFFLSLLLSILLHPVASAFSSQHQAQEVEALLTWKNSLSTANSSARGLPSSWARSPDNKTSPCSWEGIGCNSLGWVTHINLTNFGLQGTLDGFNLSSLPTLSSLDLHENELSGKIPPGIFTSLPRLTFLNLGSNQFSGNIPREVGSARRLSVLRLSDNHLAGSIPLSIGNLTNLSLLYLGNNHLSGSMPPEIGKLRSLGELRLNLNNLTGSIPASIGNLTNLTVLSLYGNQLSGPLPREINYLRHLILFFLSNNTISGFLPENICQGGILEDFCASNNRFTGTVPKGLKNCTSLTRLRLDRNSLVGNISEDFGVYPDLDYIDLSYNNFQGEVSPNWGQCRALTSLKISNNHITGEIPKETAQSTLLHFLDLSSNNLEGRIPGELGSLRSLFNLTLSCNNLSGEIPLEIGTLPELAYLDLARNKLVGPIPEKIGDCSKMIYLNLSQNNLTGSIPEQFGKLVSLQVALDLSKNSLSGTIPWQIGKLVRLEVLDLSYNHLSGSIPSTFDNLDSLRLVYLSHNNLEGPLPNNKAFLEMPIQAFGDNKGLCRNDHPSAGLRVCPKPKNDKNCEKGMILLAAIPIIVASAILSIAVRILYACYHRKAKAADNRRKDGSDHGNNLFNIWSYDGRTVYGDIIEATEGFDSKYSIGTGSSGTVYRAELSTGQVVAVKRLHVSLRFSNRTIFESEIRVLTNTLHRNIVKLLGFCSDENSILVYEYLPRGSLGKILRSKDEAMELDWGKRVNVIRGVANAINYMHYECSPPVIHRDISPNNVLLDSDFEAHVSDFGTARLLTLDSCAWTCLAGTHGYIAPGNVLIVCSSPVPVLPSQSHSFSVIAELAYTMKVTKKCDVYSFGVVALETLMGRYPLETMRSTSSLSQCSSPSSSSAAPSPLPRSAKDMPIEHMLDERLPAPGPDAMEEMATVIRLAFACLDSNPHLRPTMRQVSQQLSELRTNNSSPPWSRVLDLERIDNLEAKHDEDNFSQ